MKGSFWIKCILLISVIIFFGILVIISLIQILNDSGECINVGNVIKVYDTDYFAGYTCTFETNKGIYRVNGDVCAEVIFNSSLYKCNNNYWKTN